MSAIQRVVLIGFRGVGKSTIAKRLALALGWEYISTDANIITDIKMPIQQFVSENSWLAFREIENSIIQNLQAVQNAVIDTGGGVIENPENMKHLCPRALIIWIDADLQDIYQRLTVAGDRPLLNAGDLKSDIEKNYWRRETIYRRYSQYYVNTSEHSSLDVCSDILKFLENKND